MKEICGIFFEECSEGLDLMESGLLGLDPGTADLDVVNDIFRAAHSIKGGAATFGFTEISDFTHGVETLLDQVRAGERLVGEEIIQALLSSVDCLRGMIESLSSDADIDGDQVAATNARIVEILEHAEQPPAADMERKGPLKKWKIAFDPSPQLLKTGSDPLRLFEDLHSLGSLKVECHFDTLPRLEKMDPEQCYLHWTLLLETDRDEAEIKEAFAWIIDDCSVDIQQESEGADSKAPTPIATRKAASAGRESSSIRVSTDKVDTLLNLVGELVITQSMLKRCGDEYSPESMNDLKDGLMALERYTRELQESAMQIRMLPISVSFSRFPRLVRDLSSKMGKKVNLKFSGEATELDKNVLEKISDPLVHLVRNSLDHGIETPAQRLESGKPETGVLELSASHENGNVVIRVEDDGAGLNREKILATARTRGLIGDDEELSDEQIDQMIFHPGFSTATEVSDVSGRGVGMDVVRNNIKELSGRLEVQSRPGEGSVFSIRLPLTLAILDGQLARVANDAYVFPLQSIVETVQISASEVSNLFDAGQVYRTRDQYIPVIRLRDTFNLKPADDDNDQDSELLVIVESEGITMGVLVDELLEQQQVVIKSLEENYRKTDGLAGATILGDGRISLIVDVPGLVQSLFQSGTVVLPGGSVAA
jgi:two-component system chemotaxis sensor kinase CheA